MTDICVCGHPHAFIFLPFDQFVDDGCSSTGCECSQFMAFAPDVTRTTVVIENVGYVEDEKSDELVEAQKCSK